MKGQELVTLRKGKLAFSERKTIRNNEKKLHQTMRKNIIDKEIVIPNS